MYKVRSYGWMGYAITCVMIMCAYHNLFYVPLLFGLEINCRYWPITGCKKNRQALLSYNLMSPIFILISDESQGGGSVASSQFYTMYRWSFSSRWRLSVGSIFSACSPFYLNLCSSKQSKDNLITLWEGIKLLNQMCCLLLSKAKQYCR